METNLVKIGNSKGVIIPAKILKLIDLSNKLNIEIKGNKIILGPPDKKPREGWEAIIKTEVEKSGQPKRMPPDFFEVENNNDWTW